MKVQVVCKSKHLKVKNCLYYNIVPHQFCIKWFLSPPTTFYIITYSDLAHSAFDRLSDLCAYFCLHTLKLSPLPELEVGVDDPGIKGQQKQEILSFPNIETSSGTHPVHIQCVVGIFLRR